MDRIWITNGSTSVAPVLNPLIAACREGFVPTDIFVLDNPGIDDVTHAATSLMKTTVTAYGGAEPTIRVEQIDEELDFTAIVEYLRSTIEQGQSDGAEIAVDVTPGRKFWSIISFRAGFQYEVDHIYYTHILSSTYFGESYPTIPRTAVDLIDFTEVA